MSFDYDKGMLIEFGDGGSIRANKDTPLMIRMENLLEEKKSSGASSSSSVAGSSSPRGAISPTTRTKHCICRPTSTTKGWRW